MKGDGRESRREPLPEGVALTTDRLILRELQASDFEAVHAYASDPEVVRHMPWGPNVEEHTRSFLSGARDQALARPRTGYELAVTLGDNGSLIGAVGLHRRADDPDHADVGYCFARSAWGLGYATESVREMLRFGFEELGLRRVSAICDGDNVRSARVLEKAGLSLEGRIREATVRRGRIRDDLLYGVLRTDRTGRAGSETERSRRVLEAGMRTVALDHVQVAMPAGAEAEARAFYGEILGMRELVKPKALQGRGGCWFRVGPSELHLGVDADFVPARKAHPAWVVDDLDALAQRLLEGGFGVRWDPALPGRRRCYTEDPFGNRIELMEHASR